MKPLKALRFFRSEIFYWFYWWKFSMDPTALQPWEVEVQPEIPCMRRGYLRCLMPGAVEGPCMVLLKSSQAVGHGEMKKKVTLVAFWNGFYHFKAGIQLRRYFKTCWGLLTVLVKKAMCIHAFIHPCMPTCLPTYVHACIPYHTIS